MSVTITQAQAVDAQARLATLQTLASAEAVANATILAKLSPLGTSIIGTQHGTLAAITALAPLTTSIIGSQHGTVTSLTVLSRLPPLMSVATASRKQTLTAISRLPLVTSGHLTAAQALAAVSWIGPLRTSVRVQGTNINTVVATVMLPPLRGTASTSGHASLHASSLLHVATAGTTGARQALQATSQLRLASAASIATAITARITATLGPLATSITAKPPPAGYVADGNYYVALAARPFYASLAARPFYILSNPNMTPIFNTLDPRETLVLTFDGTADLASGETLIAIDNVAITVQSGAPTSTAPTLTGPIINGAPVTLTVNGKTITVATGCCVQAVGSGGVTGTQYLIAITCATSNPDKVLTLKGILPVSAN